MFDFHLLPQAPGADIRPLGFRAIRRGAHLRLPSDQSDHFIASPV
jgi:hypothetical protein